MASRIPKSSRAWAGIATGGVEAGIATGTGTGTESAKMTAAIAIGDQIATGETDLVIETGEVIATGAEIEAEIGTEIGAGIGAEIVTARIVIVMERGSMVQDFHLSSSQGGG